MQMCKKLKKEELKSLNTDLKVVSYPIFFLDQSQSITEKVCGKDSVYPYCFTSEGCIFHPDVVLPEEACREITRMPIDC